MVRLTILRREARDDIAIVRFVELGLFVDGSREEPYPSGLNGTKPMLFQRRDDSLSGSLHSSVIVKIRSEATRRRGSFRLSSPLSCSSLVPGTLLGWVSTFILGIALYVLRKLVGRYEHQWLMTVPVVQNSSTNKTFAYCCGTGELAVSSRESTIIPSSRIEIGWTCQPAASLDR